MACSDKLPVLSLQGVEVNAWGITLLQNISLQLSAGEVLAVIGPNGAGKSSLLSTVVGDLPVAQGRLQACGFYADGSLCDPALARQRAKQIALLPQLSLLNFPYRVAEVVALGRSPHDSGIEQDQRIVAEALAAMDIAHLSERLYTQLSGGEKQRVQLARVMAQVWSADDASPRLLLLDEPSSSLDLGHQLQLMDAIRRFAKQGVAVMMVVHDVSLAASYADCLLALDQGHPIALGTPEAVVTETVMQELFKIPLRVIQHPENGKPMVVQA